jgi:hypothetical protein
LPSFLYVCTLVQVLTELHPYQSFYAQAGVDREIGSA